MAKLTFEDIIGNIDMEKVSEAIWEPKRDGRVPIFCTDDIINIKEMVLLAGEKWLVRDLTGLTDIQVEQRIDTPNMQSKAFLDVVGTLRGTDKPFEAYGGHKIVIDWKTRDGELDTRWRNRLIDSFQWKHYLSWAGGTIFNYRGISRRCGLTDYPTKEILIVKPIDLDYQVEEFTRGIIAQRDSLINLGLTVWPRHTPDSCNMFGRECPFKADCDDYTMPKFLPELGKVMSYTSMHLFAICPERARRMEQPGVNDESDESTIGTAFHFAMAELYRQAVELKL